ncbi:heat-stable enterotoxin EAST1 [Escherichia coli]|uniref:heat-stable enterotoxin EAST1 n=1 Tax=Escherichia coli TaxID=562 RepID=UPI003306518C
MPSTQYIRRPASSYASCIWCATACASCHGGTTKQSLAIYQAPTEEAGQQALEAFAAA